MRAIVKPDWPWWLPYWRRVKSWWKNGARRDSKTARPIKIITLPPINDPTVTDEIVHLAGNPVLETSSQNNSPPRTGSGWVILGEDVAPGPISQRIVRAKKA